MSSKTQDSKRSLPLLYIMTRITISDLGSAFHTP